MEESLGPEFRDLLVDSYISSICDDCDELYYETLNELIMLQHEEVEDSDDEEEEIQQEILLLKYLLLEVSPVCYDKVLMSTQKNKTKMGQKKNSWDQTNNSWDNKKIIKK